MTDICIDIETIPADMLCRAKHIEEIRESSSLRCPSSLNTKAKLGDALELMPDVYKYKSVDELKELWIKENINQAAETSYRAQALDGSKGELLSFAIKNDQFEFSAIRKIHEDESALLKDLSAKLALMLARKDGLYNKPFFVGHNVVFDLYYLFWRSLILNVEMPCLFLFNGKHGLHYYCTSKAVSEHGKRISQNNLCEKLGYEGKPEGIDGSKIYDHVICGDYEAILSYNIDDTNKCWQNYKRIKKYTG